MESRKGVDEPIFQGRNGDLDVENGLVVTVGKGESGTDGESNIDTYTLLLLLLLLSHFMSDSVRPHRQQPTRLPHPWDSPGKNWSGLPFPSPMHESESESEVAGSCLTPSDPVDCSLPGSSAHGILQPRILEWPDS